MSKSSLSGPLSSPVFRLLWLGGLISNLGTMVQTVGAGWLMATLATSNDMVAFVQAATTLPIMLFSIPAGAIADSYERRRVLLVAQVFMMAVALGLAAVAMLGHVTPWLLLALTFLLGCGTALHTPAWQASVGDIVPRDQIAGAVTLNSMGLNLTRSVGPALGGFIVAVSGAAAAFAFNAISFVPMVFALLKMPAAQPKAVLPRENLSRAVWAGLRYVSMSPNLMIVILRGFAFGVSAVAILALLPLVARDLLDGSALIFGVLLGAFGIGAILGGLANGWLRARFSSEAVVRLAFVGMGLAACLVGFSRSVWLTSLVLLPAGASWVLALSLFNVVVQLSTPRWVVGRVLSIYQTAIFGGMTAGGWLWGALSQGFDVPTALYAAAAASGAGAVIGVWFRLPAISAQDLDPLNRFQEPATQLDMQPRSGPIFILIEYDIDQPDVPAFLAVMTDRRRIRIRDGARHWVLLRDVENPNLWKEAYHVPTWADYLRHNQRRTRMDADVTERLIALNRLGGKPHVRRMIERETVPQSDDMMMKPFQDLH